MTVLPDTHCEPANSVISSIYFAIPKIMRQEEKFPRLHQTSLRKSGKRHK